MKAKILSFFSTLLLGVVFIQMPAFDAQSGVAELPPRPQPTAVPQNSLQGGYIVLSLSAVEAGEVWTMVQWQDGWGDWHTVDGWQGTLDADGMKTWFVGPEHLGSGPFRWLVLQEDELAGMSDPFFLPGEINQVVNVAVTLD